MGLEHEELCGSVIGAAMEVHKALGPNGHTITSWLPDLKLPRPA
jgi:hypothetical protein